MPSWLPSIPYPAPDQPGFWDPVTSTLQWCEEDYYFTYYSAEIINTLTNLMFIWLAYEGVKSCRKNGHDTVFIVAYWGYFLVGFGSFMFHTTLKCKPHRALTPVPQRGCLLTKSSTDPWQLVDELNMIYTTALMAYASLSYSRSTNVQIGLGIFLSLFCVFITAYYHHIQDPTFHQNVYAALTIFIVFRSVYDMETILRPSWRRSEEKDREVRKRDGNALESHEEQAYLNKRDGDILKNMWLLVGFGVSIFLGGFALWGVDNIYCSTLRSWRRSIGMPWGFFLELHGWWHLMTGMGAYCYIVWGIHLRHVLNGKQDQYRMVWPKIYRLPEIVHVRNLPEGNGNGNGSVANGSLKKNR